MSSEYAAEKIYNDIEQILARGAVAMGRYTADQMVKTFREIHNRAKEHCKTIAEAKDPVKAAQSLIDSKKEAILNQIDSLQVSKNITRLEATEMKNVVSEMSNFKNIYDAAYNSAGLDALKGHIDSRMNLFKTDKMAFKDILEETKTIQDMTKAARLDVPFDLKKDPSMIKAGNVFDEQFKSFNQSLAKEQINNVVKAASSFVR